MSFLIKELIRKTNSFIKQFDFRLEFFFSFLKRTTLFKARISAIKILFLFLELLKLRNVYKANTNRFETCDPISNTANLLFDS